MPLAKFPQVGTKVNHYKVMEVLKDEDVGPYYLVKDTRKGGKFILKIYDIAFLEGTENYELFLQKTVKLLELTNEHIRKVVDLGQFKTFYYIVTEIVVGANLGQLIKDKNLEYKEALSYLKSIAQALAYTHENGLIHGDLKPESITISKDGLIQVGGFLEAEVAPRDEIRQNPADLRSVYWSPETLEGIADSTYSDTFSLGLIFYHMITGRVPYKKSNSMNRVEILRSADLHFHPQEIEQLPESILNLINKMTHSQLDERYSDFNQLLEDIGNIDDSQIEGKLDSNKEAERPYRILNEQDLRLYLLKTGLSNEETNKIINRAALEIINEKIEEMEPMERPTTKEELSEFYKKPISINPETVYVNYASYLNEQKSFWYLMEIGWNQLIGVVGFGLALWALYTLFYVPFYHINLVYLLAGSYFALFLSLAWIFRSNILRWLIVLGGVGPAVGLLFVPPVPISNPELLLQRTLEYTKTYEGSYALEESLMHLTVDRALQRALARTYFDEFVENQEFYYLQKSLLTWIDPDFTYKLVYGNKSKVNYIARSISTDDLVDLSDLAKGDLLVDNSDTYFGIFLGDNRWVLEKQSSQKISILKAPFAGEPIKRIKVDILRAKVIESEHGLIQQSSESP